MRRRPPFLYVVWPSSEFIAHHYDRLAPFYRAACPFLCGPRRLRCKAVERLELAPGDSVLEIGCGNGRNLKHLVGAVGPEGSVLGVDISAGMLQRARRLAVRHGWRNVSLCWEDAGGFSVPADVDAILFSLSYSIIPARRAVLRRTWPRLRAGGRLVIVDASLSTRILDGLIGQAAKQLRRRTLLIDPDVRPWDDLARLASNVRLEHLKPFDSYYICSVTKP